MAALSALRNRVKYLGGYGTDDNTRIDNAINMAQEDIASRVEKWAWLEDVVNVSTTAGVQTIAIPAAVRTVGRLRPVTDNTPAPRFTDWDDFSLGYFNRQAESTTMVGTPYNYSLYNGNIVFDAIPDAVYTYALQYYGRTTTLTADGDTPILPAEDHDTLVYGALMFLTARDKDPQMMGYWQQMYEGKVRSMRTKNKMNQSESVKKIAMPGHYYGTYDY